MSHHRIHLLARGVSLLLAVLACLVATIATGAPGKNKVVVKLTIDPQTYKVTADPDPAALHYDHQDYAEWQLATGSASPEFSIAIEDQTDPNKRKPAKKLPTPVCSGTGAARVCTSVVPTSANKGDQKYSITVKGPNGPVKTDPEVTIDP